MVKLVSDIGSAVEEEFFFFEWLLKQALAGKGGLQ